MSDLKWKKRQADEMLSCRHLLRSSDIIPPTVRPQFLTGLFFYRWSNRNCFDIQAVTNMKLSENITFLTLAYIQTLS